MKTLLAFAVCLSIATGIFAQGTSVVVSNKLGAVQNWMDDIWDTAVPGIGSLTNNAVTLNVFGQPPIEDMTLNVTNSLKVENVFFKLAAAPKNVVMNQDAGTSVTIRRDATTGNRGLTLDVSSSTVTNTVLTYNNRGAMVIDGSGASGQKSYLAVRCVDSGKGGVASYNLLGSGASLEVKDTDSGDAAEINFWNGNNTAALSSFTFGLYGSAQASAKQALLMGRYVNLLFSDSFEGEVGLGNISASDYVRFDISQSIWLRPDLVLELGNYTALGTHELITTANGWFSDAGSTLISSNDYDEIFRRVIINGTELNPYVLGNPDSFEFGQTNDVDGVGYVIDMDADSIDLTVVYRPGSEIVGAEAVSGGQMKLTVNVGGTADSYSLLGTDDLTGSWAAVPHSDDGVNPFVVTNLGYSTSDGSNLVIYVETTNSSGFFGIE